MYRVLHVASELAPYAKTGGLAEVLAGLPPQLAALGLDVTVVVPLYRAVARGGHTGGLARRLRTFPVQLGPERYDVGLYEGSFPGHPRARVWLIDAPAFYDRDGLYGPPGGGDFPDNARRFGLLCKAALSIADELDHWPDVVHGHDWQGGLLGVYAAQPPGHRRRPRRVFTIHNLAFQGLFPPSVIGELGLPPAGFHPDGYEYWGQVGLLKAGLTFADAITTVSPRYAEEIKHADHGMGLDGLLRALAPKLVGIQNGIDDHVWSPERDPHLPEQFSQRAPYGKVRCKRELQHELGLPQRDDLPLCGSVSRLTDQKGFDLVARVLPRLLRDGCQYVVLGTGDPALERALRDLEQQHKDRVRVRIGFDEGLAHRISAGADLYLMPSRFEPCGLNQLYAQVYGTPPVVRAVGGLDDTVVDFDGRSRSGTGFKFQTYSEVGLESALRRALATWRDREAWQGLMRRGMAQDFSWRQPARRYETVYRG
jgi:starch synthase